MKQPDDWDADEHDAISGLDDQLEIMRRRQAADPPLELIQEDRGDAASDQPFDALTERRVWSAIQRGLGRQPRKTSGARWIAGGLAVAATIVLAVLVSRPGQETIPAPVPAPAPPAPPATRIEFAKPEVKLSPAVLSWRGNDADNAYVRDLRPAIEAYRNNNYAEAERELASIASRYPSAIEGAFYLGIVRMLRDDFAGAVAPLTDAVAMKEPTFVDDATWFLAVAEQRSGRISDAARRFAELCTASGPRSKEACSAQQMLAVSR